MSDALDELVNRFLSWSLPDSVCSDLCVTDAEWSQKHSYPRSGTNLLTAVEARQMFEYLFPELKSIDEQISDKRKDLAFVERLKDNIDKYKKVLNRLSK